LEHTQHTGSFKPRGALNALLTRDIPPAGVVAASGGNHGAAVAWAAARLGVAATIFVPVTSPPAKAARIASYGAQVHVVEGYYDEAVVAAQTYAADRDVTSVHAFDEPAVVAGQGTLGLELREQVPDASAVLVTVGGGGLASGVTLACRDGGPSVVPIEPTSCPTLAAALAAGGPVDVEVGGIAADSTGARRVGRIAFEVFREAGIGVRTVSDEAIVDAQHVLWDRCRIATEPGGAVACAGLLTGAFVPQPGDTVVVVVCGANTATLP
jgi:threonine dehydratase